ncbi:EamA-like transporter family protein [Nonomuraea sp. KC401]|uniref:DMT family transporter n=1 Tax=unclassified Nonomuraea TaxID=2593643 RepID=UPI0010FF11BB|nr:MULTISPECIES: DMT family transporter [unclassified Nonomuraea]NBE93219.1 EamA-like transporter family protein [Nonomuraea sp. K271]TLF58284.1 EamA-like transporter family protein [Nonomuraea sp. KC401]
MSGRALDWSLAIAGGVLLTLMTQANAVLAGHTDALYASWAAHGLGAVVASLLVLALARRAPAATPGENEGRTPLWYYLGGIPGALVVVLSAIAVNSELALAGTIALMLTGQILFGTVSDHMGLLHTPRRRFTPMDLAVAGCVLAGSVLIVLGGA